MTIDNEKYNDLFNHYVEKYNGNPKHNYVHFITTMAQIDHHRTIIRPMIKWWSDVQLININLNND